MREIPPEPVPEFRESEARADTCGGMPSLSRRVLQAPQSMCEAYDYQHPAAFSRGMEICLPGVKLVFVSGTASVGPDGRSMYPGDFKSQAFRAFENARAVLRSAGAEWTDVVKVTIYIRDIQAHYRLFNEARCAYFNKVGIREYPASTCVEARLCRDDLLVEMEMIAMIAEKKKIEV